MVLSHQKIVIHEQFSNDNLTGRIGTECKRSSTRTVETKVLIPNCSTYSSTASCRLHSMHYVLDAAKHPLHFKHVVIFPAVNRLFTSQVLFYISPRGLGLWLNALNIPWIVSCYPSKSLSTFVVKISLDKMA